jgi:uncharacterized protein
MLISSRFFNAILAQYRLSPAGIHGVVHWARVSENGRRLADITGAHRDIVTLFAYLHDACRASEEWDPERGTRAAELADRWRGVYFDLSRTNFELLYTACAAQGDGLLEGDITLQTCWDADRLDIGRVGMPIIPSRLCTEAARDPDMMEWADRRARHHVVPDWLHTLWTPSPAETPPPESSEGLPQGA